jgi:hypothetical protein
MPLQNNNIGIFSQKMGGAPSFGKRKIQNSL